MKEQKRQGKQRWLSLKEQSQVRKMRWMRRREQAMLPRCTAKATARVQRECTLPICSLPSRAWTANLHWMPRPRS
eukprot:3967258-Amphidinium_carterae.2